MPPSPIPCEETKCEEPQQRRPYSNVEITSLCNSGEVSLQKTAVSPPAELTATVPGRRRAAEPPVPAGRQGQELCGQGEAGTTSPPVLGDTFRQGEGSPSGGPRGTLRSRQQLGEAMLDHNSV